MTMLNMSRGPLWLLGGLLTTITGCGGSGFVSPTFLKITGTSSILDIGETAALRAVAHLSDDITHDVTSGKQGSIVDSTTATLSSGIITAKAAGLITAQAAHADLRPAVSGMATVLGNVNLPAQVLIGSAVTTSMMPTITWPYPRAIRYGTPLSSAQLNARANVPGTFVYTPGAGAVLRAGLQTISATFTPEDAAAYAVTNQAVPIQVNQVVPTIDWPPITSIEQGTALATTQLNATSNVFGRFTYHPGAGTVLPAGTQQLTVSFSPNDTRDYAAVMAGNSITVNGSTSTSSCGGPTVSLDSSMSTSQIQSAIAGAADCSLILFAAGTYNITSSIAIPCPSTGLTIAGPTVAWPGPFTGVLNGSVAGGWGFSFGSCSSPITIEYLNWNGGEPPVGGGGFLYVAPATSNLTVRYNFIHGNQANPDSGHEYDSLIWFDGMDTDPVSRYDNNNTVEWNIFGNSNDGTPGNADCGALSSLFNYQGGYYDQIGGYCAAIALDSSTNNFTVANNIIQYQEEGFKLYEGGSVASQEFYDANLNFTYNDIAWIHRISVEGQQTGNPTMNFNYNDIHDQVNPAWGSWGFSLPQSGANNCEHNVLIANLLVAGAPTAGPGSVEFWGNGNCDNNLVQGYWGAGMQYGFGNTPWTLNNNIIQQLANLSYINNEEEITCCYPQMSGNAESQNLATVTSAAPTISFGPTGTISAGIAVTIVDTGVTNGGIGPQGNTTIYYTTDGSTPTTSSAVCNPTPGSTSCSISVAAGATVKAIGMWGSINQPKSYPTGYGFVPSAVVTASY
jgi:hypothetical protein